MRQDAGADRNLLAGQSVWIALPVPAFMMAEDQRRDRIGERHCRDDLRPDLRMDADFLEFLLCERARLRQHVLGHGELADVVQQRGGLDALNLVRRQSRRSRQAGRIHLYPPDVRLRRLILGVDGAGQRFDGREMQIRGLLDVPLLVLDAAHVDLIGAVGQIDRRERQRRHPVARLRDDPDGEGGAAGADKVARRAPQKGLAPGCRESLAGRQGNRPGDEHGVDDEIDEGGDHQRHGHGAEPADRAYAEQIECQAGPFDREHERGHAEQRPMYRGAAARTEMDD